MLKNSLNKKSKKNKRADLIISRSFIMIKITQNVLVAQLDRAFPSEGKGRAFESHQAR